ncbi:hypothetical protein CRYUN_Cryun01aG0092200 [Craigia yunnanensis]
MVGEVNAMGLLVPSPSQKQTPKGLTAGFHSESGSVELKSQQDFISEMDDIEDDTFNLMAMHSIMNLMREAELQEEAAEQTKEEAARGGLDILVKVEECKEMLPHAKEANNRRC